MVWNYVNIGETLSDDIEPERRPNKQTNKKEKGCQPHDK